MKIVLSNFISATAAQPFKQGTWIHLQEGIAEGLAAHILARLGPTYDATKVYLLYGCENSTVPPIYTVTAGAVFYGGEIYLVPAFSFTAANDAVGAIDVSYFAGVNADPVEFTDTVNHNVHAIRRIIVTDVASVGNLDFDNWEKGWTTVSDTAQASIFGGSGIVDSVIVETKYDFGYIIKRFKIQVQVSSGPIRIDFPLPGYVSDNFAQAILCPFYVSTTFNNLGNGKVVGDVLQITSATGSVGLATYIITGQIMYKV